MTAESETGGNGGAGRDLGKSLEHWLEDRLPGSGLVKVGPLQKPGSGLSAGTFLFEASRGSTNQAATHQLVVRIPPDDESSLFFGSDLAHEVKIQNLLAEHGVPVARLVGLETEPAVLGSPFVVTRRVKGRLVDSSDPYMSSGWLHDLSAEFQQELAHGFMRTLADIHRVPIEEVRRAGLYGTALQDTELSGTGSFEMQHTKAALDRWSAYLTRADNGVAPDALFDALRWCTDNLPAEEPPPALLWGDAQLANAVFADDGSTAAVLDFELSTVGPAELDLGWFFCLHEMTVARCGEDLPGFTDRPGLIGRYEERLGRQVSDLEWYEVFGAVCTASILVRMSSLLSLGGHDARWLARSNPALEYLAQRL